jgi:hypothetical protein
MAIVLMPQRVNQSANRARSSVKGRNVRTGCSSESGNFLIGIARKRHHLQVRNHPWTKFLYGDRSTKKHSATPLRTTNRAVCFYRTGGLPIRARSYEGKRHPFDRAGR